MAQARAWCFTLNNPTAQLEFTGHRYAVWQKEVGEKGTEHYQGYVEWLRPLRLAAVKKLLPTAHLEPRAGSREQARAYCMKEESRVDGPWESGEWETHQGKRTDLEAACEVLKEEGLKRVAEEMPSVFVKFHKGLSALEKISRVKPRDLDFVPRPWQAKILRLVVDCPADDRKIMWVTDVDGNIGKSRLASHLIMEHGAIELSGRVVDMGYAYNSEPIVIFDISRTQADNLNHLYSFAEQLKNGRFLSTKYESEMKLFKPPHVIFFSNSPHEEGKWSKDRIQVFDSSMSDFWLPLPEPLYKGDEGADKSFLAFL